MDNLYTLLQLVGAAMLFSVATWAILCAVGALMNAMRGVNLMKEHWYLNFFPWMLGLISNNEDEIPYSSLKSLSIIFAVYFMLILLMYAFA